MNFIKYMNFIKKYKSKKILKKRTIFSLSFFQKRKLKNYYSSISRKYINANLYKNQEGFLLFFNESKNYKNTEEKKYTLPKECIEALKNYLDPNKVYIFRTVENDSYENNLSGYYDSIITPYEKIEESINYFTKNNMKAVWIQIYRNDLIHATISTYNHNYTKPLFIHNEKSVSTEISKENKEITDEKVIKKLDKVLKKCEKIFKSPVVIELGYSEKEIQVFQIKKMEEKYGDSLDFNSIAVKLFPHYIKDLTLCEDFITKASVLSGTIIEDVFNGKIIFIKGFLFYTNKICKNKYEDFVSLKGINDSLNHLHENLLKYTKETFHIHYLYNRLISYMYRTDFYLDEEFYIEDIDNFLPINGNEYEICNDRIFYFYEDNTSKNNQKKYSDRDFTHYLLVKINYIYHFLLKINQSKLKVSCKIDLINQYDLTFLFNEDYRARDTKEHVNYCENDISYFYENHRLKHIVNGKINGTAWNIDETNLLPPLNTETKYILCGEEISSNWIKNLHLFNGIITKYGLEITHFALSAKELNIPYILLDDVPKHLSYVDV